MSLLIGSDIPFFQHSSFTADLISHFFPKVLTGTSTIPYNDYGFL